jgi:hypothetical protein
VGGGGAGGGATLSRDDAGGDFTLAKHEMKKVKDKLRRLKIEELNDLNEKNPGNENEKATLQKPRMKKKIFLGFSKNFKPGVKEYRKNNKNNPYLDRDYLEDLSDMDDDEKEILNQNVCSKSSIQNIFIFFYFLFLVCSLLRIT